ncbi:MAG: 30S ribosomal protein S12 methylthiotransferase RimO [Bacteroidales bacterium]|nr:30S ribosomal protein S12 methylthiotransferase RimO [Bacteroidales bacterium]
MARTLQVITLGCSKNTVDTEHLLAQLGDAYAVVPEDFDGPVDVLLVNTCGFIGDSKEQSIQTIFAAVDRKNKGLVGKLMVFGCLSQRYSAQMPDLIPEVDGWFGARDLAPIVKALGVKYDKALEPSRYGAHGSYAYLKISEGCDRRCSYCAIPYIRGAHKSVPMEVLVEEASALARQGVRELVLIAQDTTYYGLDLYKRRALAELLQKLSEIDGIEWIRIHYSYPADFPEDVLDQMANNPKVCRYMDIPLQHVADKVLDNMHRHVDGAWTRALIRKMRERVPGIVLRTTMIVGHPGEGRKEFEELLDFVEEAKFERLGAFMYSEEEGTYGADNFEDKIAKKTKKSRLERLMTLQRGISFACNQARVGTEVRVLVDSVNEGMLVCRSEYESPEVDGEILVRHVPEIGPDPVGKFIKVKIVQADEYDLVGEFIVE